MLPSMVIAARKARRKRAISRQRGLRLTAMSGLSAKVSSCGGEGALLGRGGEALGGGAAVLVAFFARWKMGASFLTSSSGADESPLLSESDIFAVGWCWVVAVSFAMRSQVVVLRVGKSGRENVTEVEGLWTRERSRTAGQAQL